MDEHVDAASPPARPVPGERGNRPAAPRAPSHRRRRLPEELGVIVALGLLVGVIGALKPAFVDPDNLLNLTASNAFVGILSLGMVFLLAMREIDLSIGWMFNFSAVVCALAIRNGVDPFLAGGTRHRLRCVLGLFNGVLAVGLRLPVLIVTLGTLSMYRGLSLVVNDSRRSSRRARSVTARSSSCSPPTFRYASRSSASCSSPSRSCSTSSSTRPASAIARSPSAAIPRRPVSPVCRSAAPRSRCSC